MRRERLRRGHTMLELALFLPWYFFVFVGAFDWGHYAYALISVENAARVAALYTSSMPGTAADVNGACSYVLTALSRESNVGDRVASCGAEPVVVTAEAVEGPDRAPASLVTVHYRTPQLIPIPGLLPGRITVSRAVRMRVRG